MHQIFAELLCPSKGQKKARTWAHPIFASVVGSSPARGGSPGLRELMPTPNQQADLVRELPDVFHPVPGGWERMGITHIRLAKGTEEVLAGALRTAWKLRVEKNERAKRKKRRRADSRKK
jgi:hypothetical protein